MFTEKKIVFILICLGTVTVAFNVAGITAAIPTIALDLNLPDLLVAKIIPYYLIPYWIGALIYAPLTRHFSYRKVLGISMALYALSCFICGMINLLNHFLLMRIAMGIAGASVTHLGLMIIGDFFEKKVRGRLVGIFFSCNFFASFVGIVLSGTAHWRWLFLPPSMLGMLLAIIFLRYDSDILKRTHKASVNYLRVMRNLKIQKVFFFIFCISFLYHGVHQWYGVYLSQVYHLERLAISFFFILTVVAGFFGQLLGGIISDKKGRLTACVIGILSLSLGVMFLAGIYPLYILGVILVLISIGWTIVHNGLSTALTDFPDDQRPSIASLNSSVRFISGGLGFFVSSFFVEKSFGLTFLIFGILILLLGCILDKIMPRHEWRS